ncbi:predicted protein [Naegleria gruberi]|uniref:Predicted protein n=1 Tax=Naegleria gruberi TaxID=5762 RepID=D2VNN1_NAEGR|nr:uncharacterized protein NAEGRDRAFT_51038 [Naegleria gruberi]EFC41532.1 predicted protein [Naegleria gruberi]|eukprot:XP_002674276.1 predicted protein [Naegleria gruberi strain NEG-M]
MSKAPATFLFGKAGSFIRTKILKLSENRQQIVHYFSPSWIPANNLKLISSDDRIEEISILNNISTNIVVDHEKNDGNNGKKEYTIFFPGDIQLRLNDFMKYLQVDYPFESSFDDDENGRVMEVYYEHVLDILYRKYPETSGLVIIQPNTLDLSSFIYEYENFYVKGNANAVLFEILDNLFPNEGFGRNVGENQQHVQLNLVAFSKGCVALNSILSETANCANCLAKNVNHLNESEDYLHWDEKPNKLVLPCYKITLKKEGQRNLNREEMERCVGLLKYNVKSINFVDCHRFITSEKLLTSICKLLDERIHEDAFKFKIHQTPLINEDNQFRKHIKYESDLFIKTLKKIYSSGEKNSPCPFLSYQYYYDELEGKVDSFLLHFKVLTDFEQ